MIKRWFIAFLACVFIFCYMLTAQDEGIEPADNSKAAKDEVTDISDEELQKRFEIFTKVIETVSKNYVNKVDRGKMVEGALRGMMAELDPHSAFLTKDEMEEMNIDLQGEFEGVGIVIQLDENGILSVITPIEGTPAYKAGVLAGDKIMKIDGDSTRGITLHEAVLKLRGKKGTKVEITVFHKYLRKDEKIPIIRGTIPLISVHESKIVDENEKIGYVRLSAFQFHSSDEMKASLEDLVEKGLKGLVFDLRDNGGGLLRAAIDISNLFLKEGTIVSVKGRDEKGDGATEYATSKDTFAGFPIVVLVNNYSASASEIVAAALRDNHRAVLLGEKTFGKGSVQKLIYLDDGSGIKLTIQKYYTPKGISIDKKGIDPDVVEKMSYETKLAIFEQRRKALIEKNRNPDVKDPQEGEALQIDEEEEKKEFVDTQLQRAIDILKGVQIFRRKLEMSKK